MLQQVNEIKYLGLILDSELNFTSHIKNICSKLARVTGLCHSLRGILPLKAFRSIYYSLGYPYLILHNVVWGGAPSVKINKIQVAQNKLVRSIAGNFTSTRLIYKNLNILNIYINKAQSARARARARARVCVCG